MHHAAVGFNNIDVAAATARGIAVGNTPGVLTDATADMAFCLLIAAARRLVESYQYAQAGKWKTWEPLGHLGQDLTGRTLGVIGMGRIGYAWPAAAHLEQGHEGSVPRHLPQRRRPELDLDAEQVDLDTLLAASDFVSVHTDLNEKTTRPVQPHAVSEDEAVGDAFLVEHGPRPNRSNAGSVIC